MEGKILNLVRQIVTGYYKSSEDDKLLKDIAECFHADFSIIATVDINKYITSGGMGFNVYLKGEIANRIDINSCGFSGALKDTILNNRELIIKNYTEYENAVEEWIKAGVKSLISVPIYRGSILGGLQAVSTTRVNSFSSSELKHLRAIADTIAINIENETLKLKNKLLSESEEIHLRLIRGLQQAKEKAFDQWIMQSMDEVMKATNCDTAGFIMPDENIYAVTSTISKYRVLLHEVNNYVKSWPMYQLWLKHPARDYIPYGEAITTYNLQLSNNLKELGVSSGMFVFIKKNSVPVAIIAFGFKKKTRMSKYHRVFLQKIGTDLTLSVLAYRRLSDLSSLLSKTESEFIHSTMKFSEIRDIYTKGHSERVAYYARRIAEILEWDERQQSYIYTAGLLHDIGKIGIPDNILLKPGKLSKNEMRIIKYHAILSYEIVKDVELLKPIANWIKHHHERCNGSGYPDGLKCNEIEEGARIIAIADVFDALTSERTYREKKEYTIEEAIEILFNSHLDSTILRKIKKHLYDMRITEKSQESEELDILKEIENVRLSIFTKDYLTGAERLSVFTRHVNEMISQGQPFYMVCVDIVNINYINYMYSIEYGNRIIECLAEELMSSKHINHVMRSGADSFIFMYEEDNLNLLKQTLIQIEKSISAKFPREEPLSHLHSSPLYKAIIRFPDCGSDAEELIYALRNRIKEEKEKQKRRTLFLHG